MPKSDYETDEADRRANNEEKSKNMRQRIWNLFFRDRSAAWTAIFTGVLVFFTYKLYQVADRSDETNRVTQRAFVSFTGVGGGVGMVSADRKARTAQEIILNWTNSGNTPARKAITRASGNIWPGELPQGYDFPDLPGGNKEPITLGPRASAGVRAIVPINYFRDTREGKARLYVWGWIVYDDVFSSDPHLTEFCTELVQITVQQDATDISDPKTPFGWNTASCKEGNCTDQDCRDYSARIHEARAK
jgi:hypothetical protein